MTLRRLSGVVLLIGLMNGCAGDKHDTNVSPQSAQTRLQLGMQYLAANNLDAARQNLDKAVQSAPADYRTQLGMALYEQRVGENDAAQKRYNLALKLAPQNSTV